MFNFIQIMLFIYIWRALAIYEYNDLYYLKNEATWHIIKPNPFVVGVRGPMSVVCLAQLVIQLCIHLPVSFCYAYAQKQIGALLLCMRRI